MELIIASQPASSPLPFATPPLAGMTIENRLTKNDAQMLATLN